MSSDKSIIATNMQEQNPPLPIELDLKAGLYQNSPPFTGQLPRITVLLGTNGSGKSKLLGAIQKELSNQIQPLQILRYQPRQDVGRINLQASTPLAAAISQYGTNRTNQVRQDEKSTTNYSLALNALYAHDISANEKFVVETRLHENNPSNFKRPQLPESYIKLAFNLFEEFFSLSITRNIETTELVISTKDNEQRYFTDTLSGGESWVLSVLPDFILFKDQSMTAIVDEPESFLNEALAISFWSKMEAERPSWRFVYSTHSVEFASRPGIEKILLLKSINEAPLEFTDIQDIPIEDRRKILGYAPRVVKSERTLFIEGEAGSIDESFYPIIIDDKSVLISPASSCNDVIKAVKGTNIWEKAVRGGNIVRGLADRDYRSNEQIKSLTSNELMALDLHDLEAYLCLPKLLASFAVSVSARVTKQSDFENMILEWAAKRRVETIVAHLNNLMRTAFGERGISISGTYNDDLSKIHKAFVLERNSTIKTLDQRFSDANIKRYIDEMDKKINDAISMRDINAILVLFKGKQLFEELKPHVSLQDTNQAVRLIAEKTLVNEIPELGKLRIALRKLLGLAE